MDYVLYLNWGSSSCASAGIEDQLRAQMSFYGRLNIHISCQSQRDEFFAMIRKDQTMNNHQS
jgi:hypothetical protein